MTYKQESVTRHNFNRHEVAHRWVDGVPTGNGVMGAMTWDGPDNMQITLDRADLWLTPGTHKAEFTAIDELRRLCAGSLHVATPGQASCFHEGLNLFDATGFRKTTRGMDGWQWMLHATRPLFCLQTPATLPEVSFRWQEPRLIDHRVFEAQKFDHELQQRSGEVNTTDPYAGRLTTTCDPVGPAMVGTIHYDGRPLAMIMAAVFQDGEALPLTYREGVFSATKKQEGKPALLLLTIGCLRRESELDVDHLRDILWELPDWNTLADEHRAWWASYWARSGMHLSDRAMDRLWHTGNYILGCNARQDSPTIALQGIWSEDGNVPWGDRLGWDLNIQATYSPIYTGNHLEFGFSLYDWIRDMLPNMQDFAKQVFGDAAEGAFLYPGCDDMGNTWTSDSCGGVGAGGWICHNFWQHFLYTHDLTFLRDYCLPVFTEFLKCQRFAWYKGKDGRYHLDRAQSPEIQGLRTPENPVRDTTYEIALAKNLASNYLAALRHLGMPQDESLARWAQDFNANVVAYPTSSRAYHFPSMEPGFVDYLVEWPGLDTNISHRHLSHMLMIHPLGDIHRFSDYRDLWLGRNTVSRMMDRGVHKWMGYTFPWASLMATRMGGFPKMPSFMLELVNQLFANPFNGLVLGEESRGVGLVSSQIGAYPKHFGTFTIEAGMFAVAAVQDALVHTAGEYTVVGGGVSPDCDGEFWNLRSEAGELISGVIEHGQVVCVEMTQERKGNNAIAIPSTTDAWRALHRNGDIQTKDGHVLLAYPSTPGGFNRFERTSQIRNEHEKPYSTD